MRGVSDQIPTGAVEFFVVMAGLSFVGCQTLLVEPLHSWNLTIIRPNPTPSGREKCGVSEADEQRPVVQPLLVFSEPVFLVCLLHAAPVILICVMFELARSPLRTSRHCMGIRPAKTFLVNKHSASNST